MFVAMPLRRAGRHDRRVSIVRGSLLNNPLALLISGCALTMLAACASPPFVGRPGLQVVQSAELPAPEPVDLQTEARASLIGPGDELSIDVFGLPELSRLVRVDATGSIAIPLAGTVQAANLTTDQLTAALRERLRASAIRDPKVTVNVTTSVGQAVTVDGEVKTPGQFSIAGSTTLMRVIARGGGVTEYAQQNHVVVFRRVNNQDMAALYDLRAIRQGIYKDPTIYANDIVLVGESHAQRIFQSLLQASSLLSAPLVAVLNKS